MDIRTQCNSLSISISQKVAWLCINDKAANRKFNIQSHFSQQFVIIAAQTTWRNVKKNVYNAEVTLEVKKREKESREE